LKGIICHTGQVSGGHYTAKCLRPQNGPGNGPCWVEFNDTRTRTIQNLEELQSNQNYILFYEMNEATKRFW
jgi:ubiquitin C-terminal hydrolase